MSSSPVHAGHVATLPSFFSKAVCIAQAGGGGGHLTDFVAQKGPQLCFHDCILFLTTRQRHILPNENNQALPTPERAFKELIPRHVVQRKTSHQSVLFLIVGRCVSISKILDYVKRIHIFSLTTCKKPPAVLTASPFPSLWLGIEQHIASPLLEAVSHGLMALEMLLGPMDSWRSVSMHAGTFLPVPTGEVVGSSLLRSLGLPQSPVGRKPPPTARQWGSHFEVPPTKAPGSPAAWPGPGAS